MSIEVEARIEKHSIAPNGVELISFVNTFPRSILAEVNTHCVLSKNTSSSRAIPYRRKGERREGQPMSMREMVMESPYLPLYWGRNEAGMQATTELNEEEILRCKERILWLRDQAIYAADQMWDIGLHKQDCNRYLEPWSWTTQVITGTDWANFFALRTHKDAHPAFRLLARKMYILYKKSKPTLLQEGEWHLPFVDSQDSSYSLSDLKIMSIARCARVSYNNFEGFRDFASDLSLYEKLSGASPKHMSPFGHQGTPMIRADDRSGNFRGWHQLRKEITGENITVFEPTEAELLTWGLY